MNKLVKLGLISLVTTFMVVTGNVKILLAIPNFLSQNYPDQNQTEADRLLELGISQQKKGQLSQALESVRAALVIYENLTDRQGEANSLSRIGEIYFNLGEYQESIDFYYQSLAILEKSDDRDARANVIDAIANNYLYLGKNKFAQQLRQQAEALRKEIGNPPQEAAFLGNTGITYQSEGKYKQAIELYQQELAKAQKEGDPPKEMYALSQLEAVYQESGEYQQANVFYTEQLTRARANGDHKSELYFLSQLGLGYQQLKQYSQALGFDQQQLELARKIGDINAENKALAQIGKVYESEGKYQEVIDFYQQQLEVVRKIGDPDGETIVVNQIAQAYINQKQYSQAIEFYQKQLAIAQQKNDLLGAGKIFNNIGLIWLKSGNFTAAQTNLDSALNIWETLRANPDHPNYFRDRDLSYHRLQQLLIAQQQPEAALEIAEREQWRNLLDLLKIRLKSEPVRIGWKTARPQFDFITIKQIQQIAREQKATIVKYSIIDDDSIYTWIVDPNGKITFREIKIKAENTIYPVNTIKEVVTSMSTALALNSSKGVVSKPPALEIQKKPLLQLYQLLINPIKELLPTDSSARVIFVPSPELLTIPFPALIDTYGKYLIEKYPIAFTPAIKLLDFSRTHKRNFSGKQMLLLGNPTMPSIPIAVGEASQLLPPILDAEQEVLEIAKLFNTKPPLIGNKATKAALLPLLPKAQSIHLATYGLLDDWEWMGLPGAIAIAPFGIDNGLLTAREILELYTQEKPPHLQAELVVISRGGILPPIGNLNQGQISGTGIMGLSTALLASGVTTVILPLWSSPEQPITFFMGEFYQQLKQKPDKLQALRKAAIATMTKYPNPRDWAGFGLIGECK